MSAEILAEGRAPFAFGSRVWRRDVRCGAAEERFVRGYAAGAPVIVVELFDMREP